MDDCLTTDKGAASSASYAYTVENSLRNQLVIHADCHAANRGLFAGILVLAATAVSIIIFFLAFSDHNYVSTGIWVNLVSESTLLVLMIGAVLLACRQLTRLDVNPQPVSLLDDLLLFLCIPCFFLYGIFSIVPAMTYSNYMSLFVSILQVFHNLRITITLICLCYHQMCIYVATSKLS